MSSKKTTNVARKAVAPKKVTPKKTVPTKKVVVAKKTSKMVPKKDAEVAKNLGSCPICFDDFASSKQIVKCPFCLTKTCTQCCQDYLLTSTKKPHCMSAECKKEWDPLFFSKTLPEKFRLGPYLEAKKKNILDEQRSALPGTMPLVESKKKEEKLRKENQDLKVLLKTLQEKEDAVFGTIQANNQTIKTGIAPGARKLYILKCPVVVKIIPDEGGGDGEQEMCRGFIESDTFACTLCKATICNKCHLLTHRPTETPVKGTAKQAPSHKCKKEDVESATFVMADTKPCPNCSARINKIMGCDQMFCVLCQTAFSWNTGLIETGVIHNPHYYELQRKLGTNRRAAGDVPCGGIPDARHIVQLMQKEGRNETAVQKLLNIHRRTAEISSYIRNRNRDVAAVSHEPIRLDYLLGKLTEEQFAEAVYERTCVIEKRREELQILATFETAVIERINHIIEEGREINNRRILRADYEKEKEEDDEGEDEGDAHPDYTKMTVAQLKEILRDRELPLFGLKADLINRLQSRAAREPLPAVGMAQRELAMRLPKKRRAHKRGRVRTSVKTGPKSSRAPSLYMSLPAVLRAQEFNALFDEFMTEITKIVEFCNKAFEENFMAMGYKDFPVINLNEEYRFPRNEPAVATALVALPRPDFEHINRPHHRPIPDSEDSDSSDDF